MNEIFAPLDWEFLTEFVGPLVQNIQNLLLNKVKPLCTDMIKTLEIITLKFMEHLDILLEHINFDELIDMLLLNGITK